MTVATTATATPTIADLNDDVRQRLVRILLDQLMRPDIEKSTALLWLTGLGLTPDGDVISHALAARWMRDNIADGTMAPADVDDTYTCSREEAQADLVALYQGEYDDAVRTLATVATPTPAQNSRRRLHLRLARHDHGYLLIDPAWLFGLSIAAAWVYFIFLAIAKAS